MPSVRSSIISGTPAALIEHQTPDVQARIDEEKSSERCEDQRGGNDARIADALADVLTGGADADMTQPVPADRVMALEREPFMRLIRTEKTLARI